MSPSPLLVLVMPAGHTQPEGVNSRCQKKVSQEGVTGHLDGSNTEHYWGTRSSQTHDMCFTRSDMRMRAHPARCCAHFTPSTHHLVNTCTRKGLWSSVQSTAAAPVHQQLQADPLAGSLMCHTPSQHMPHPATGQANPLAGTTLRHTLPTCAFHQQVPPSPPSPITQTLPPPTCAAAGVPPHAPCRRPLCHLVTLIPP
jgi:hypothetical protein